MNASLIEAFEALNEKTVFQALGIRVESYDPAAVRVAIDVDERHLQHAGVVHGGVFVVLAESAASLAAALTVDIGTHAVSGMEINANHLRPVSSGKVVAQATLLYQGKTTMVYNIVLTDAAERLVCVSRCTIAVRKREG